MEVEDNDSISSGAATETTENVEVEPKMSADEWKQKGNEKYKSGNYRSAVEFYNEAIEMSPTTAAYYGNRAAANFMMLKYKNVIEDCNRATVIDSSFVKGYSRKAKAQLAMGDIAGAIKSYQTGLIQDPNNASLINEKKETEMALDKVQRGRAHLENKRYSQALSCFDGALKVATGSKQLKISRAEALMGRERYDEAFAVLTQLMRSDSQTPELLFLRSRCLYFQGEFANAIKHLKQALQSDPDNSKYQKEIKRIRNLENQKTAANEAFKNRKWQEAIDAYSACLLVDPENKQFNAKLHCNRATAYSKLNKMDEAIKDCDTALYYDASYAKACLRKAACLRQKGTESDLDQALREYDRASKLVSSDAQRDIQLSIRETKMELKKAKRIDFYKILEVGTLATAHEIKKAYRKLALKWHPDRHANSTDEEKVKAEETFKQIGEAYAILSDAEKKQRYDSGQDEDFGDFDGGGGHGGHGGMPPGVDPSDIFNMFFGGGGGGGGRGGRGGGGGHHHFG